MQHINIRHETINPADVDRYDEELARRSAEAALSGEAHISIGVGTELAPTEAERERLCLAIVHLLEVGDDDVRAAWYMRLTIDGREVHYFRNAKHRAEIGTRNDFQELNPRLAQYIDEMKAKGGNQGG